MYCLDVRVFEIKPNQTKLLPMMLGCLSVCQVGQGLSIKKEKELEAKMLVRIVIGSKSANMVVEWKNETKKGLYDQEKCHRCNFDQFVSPI